MIGQARDPDRQGDRVRLAVHQRRPTNAPASATRPSAIGAEPEQPGQLADDDDQRDAVEVAVADRRGQQVGQEAEPRDARRDDDHPDDDRQQPARVTARASSPAASGTIAAAMSGTSDESGPRTRIRDGPRSA